VLTQARRGLTASVSVAVPRDLAVVVGSSVTDRRPRRTHDRGTDRRRHRDRDAGIRGGSPPTRADTTGDATDTRDGAMRTVPTPDGADADGTDGDRPT
jgi:hypothetical protein